MVLKFVDLLENLFDLPDVLGWSNPQLLPRFLEAFRLDFLDLVDRIITLLPPFEFFIKEVKHREVKAPQIVASCEVDVVVGVQRREGHSATEVCLLALGHDLHVVVKMLFGETEVNDKDSTVLLAQNKVGCLHVAMNEPAVVHLLDGHEHLQQDVDRNLQAVSVLKTATSTGQVDAEEVHDD